MNVYSCLSTELEALFILDVANANKTASNEME